MPLLYAKPVPTRHFEFVAGPLSLRISAIDEISAIAEANRRLSGSKSWTKINSKKFVLSSKTDIQRYK